MPVMRNELRHVENGLTEVSYVGIATTSRWRASRANVESELGRSRRLAIARLAAHGTSDARLGRLEVTHGSRSDPPRLRLFS